MAANLRSATRPAAVNNPGEGRSDQDNLALIEQKKALYDSLRADQIRNEHDLRTSEQAVEEALKAAREEFGVDSVEALRKMLVESRIKNTSATDNWLAAIDRVQRLVEEADRTP